jgi:parallel beta-helix repeat protein
MFRRTVSGMLFALLIVSITAPLLNIQPVKADATIYIRADGSIDPPTALISTVDNVIYRLTGNITSDADGIVIKRNNTVVDGAGYTIQGAGSGTGIDLSERRNVTVKNIQIIDFDDGIQLEYSSNNTISRNNIVSNWYGIQFYYSYDNSISGNNIMNNLYGIRLSDSSNNSIYHNNFINNTRQVYDWSWDYPEHFPSLDIWDSGCEGNYWSAYAGEDLNRSMYGPGIGDSPYIIDESNQDNYPLMSPFMLGDVNHDKAVNMVDISIIAVAFRTQHGEKNWNPHADLDENRKINIIDLSTVATELGKEWKNPEFGGYVTSAALARAVISDMLLDLDATMSYCLQIMEQNLPYNPIWTSQIQGKIEMLQDPNLTSTIIEGNFFAADSVSSIGGTQIPIVAIFAAANMRDQAIQAVRNIKVALPVLESFMGIPFPSSSVKIWYGFTIGNRGGGGTMWMEDQESYEERSRQMTLFPYEPVFYHELSHSYIGHESLTQFLEIYLHNIVHTNSTDFPNWIYLRNYYDLTVHEGYAALLNIYKLIGRDAMANAYRIIYSLNPPYGEPLSQQCQQVFVDQAPDNLKPKVAELVSKITY